MKFVIPIQLFALLTLAASLLGGCAYVPKNLAMRYGWTVERINENEFRITAAKPAPNRHDEGLAVGGDVAASHGFPSFIIVADPERPDSASSFDWGLTYDGRPGLMAWSIGSSFRIKCFSTSSKGDLKLDAAKTAARFSPTVKS